MGFGTCTECGSEETLQCGTTGSERTVGESQCYTERVQRISITAAAIRIKGLT